MPDAGVIDRPEILAPAPGDPAVGCKAMGEAIATQILRQ